MLGATVVFRPLTYWRRFTRFKQNRNGQDECEPKEKHIDQVMNFSNKDLKAALRTRVRALRDGLSLEDRLAKGEAVARLLKSWAPLKQSSSIAAFRAFGSEVNLDPLIRSLLADGRQVYVPRVRAGKTLELCRVKDLENGWIQHRFGVLEPAGGPGMDGEPEVDPASIDLYLMPGVAFDPAGNRLGFGMGYYDDLVRKAGSRPVRVGVAFDCQMMDALPVDVWDERVDWIATESGVVPGAGVVRGSGRL